MDVDEARLVCLELALQGNQQKEHPVERAKKYEKFVMCDEMKLGCLRCAVKSDGGLARISAEGVIDKALTYLAFVTPEPPAKPAVRKRRRSRKT